MPEDTLRTRDRLRNPDATASRGSNHTVQTVNRCNDGPREGAIMTGSRRTTQPEASEGAEVCRAAAAAAASRSGVYGYT